MTLKKALGGKPLRVPVALCSGQQIPDTILSRFSAVTGETPSFA
ncbi:hypothetical protein [Vibrio neonatus]